MLLLKIAWRNIWRKKTRSLIIIFAVTLGIWAGLFISSFMQGFINEMMETTINHYISHVQIHNPGFKDNNEIQYTIQNPEKVMSVVNANPDVKAATIRTCVNGMASSPNTAAGVRISGIDPVNENAVTNYKMFIKQGTYFEDNKKNEVVIGKKLAEKLMVKLHSKIVITFAAPDGNIMSGAFRICGIYKSSNSQIDGINIFVNDRDLNVLMGKDSGYHEIALMVKDDRKVDTVKAQFQKQFPTLKVETWKELSPETATMNEFVAFTLWILMTIMMIGLAFAIVNTMLMAVMERTRELGMLMSIGMNKSRTFKMIMYETISLSFFGCPIGLVLAYLTIWYFGKHGVDLSTFSKGMENFGMSTKVYPGLYDKQYFQVAVLVFVTALVSAIFPSIRAIRLKPAEAVRKV